MNKKDATVTIVKDAQPDDAQDFGFTTTGAGLTTSRSTMTPTRRCRTRRRSRSRRRLRLEDGHRDGCGRLVEHELVCSEGTGHGSTATFEVDPGDTITCTYVNKKDATVTVVKDAQPDDAQDFEFTTTGSQLSGFSLDDDGDADAVEHEGVHGLGCRLRFQDDHRVGGRRVGR